MHKKRPESIGTFTNEGNPDASKEGQKSDREKYVAAINLWSEAIDLWADERDKTFAIVGEMLEASGRDDMTDMNRCMRDLAKTHRDYGILYEKQYEKCGDALPDDFSDMKNHIEKFRKQDAGESQTSNDKRSTLQSLADKEIEKFTV